jgi:hypothetical protein
MRRWVAIVFALSGVSACNSAGTPGPTDPNGQNGFNVGGPAMGGAGTAAPAPTSPDPTTGQAGTGSAVPTVLPTAGTGGSALPPMAGTVAPTPTQPTGPTISLDECNLNTRWRGDEYCILPPPAGEGFQLHVGPTNYDNPERQWIVQPGVETNENVSAVSPNNTEIYYYFRQYRMRPGSHHMILSRGVGGIGGGAGGRIGGTQVPAKDSPTGGEIAPENQGVGMRLPANTPLSFSLHYYNFTDAPLLKDVWVNVWYRDREEVTEAATEMFSMLLMPLANVTPGRHAVISGSCPVSGNGRLLTIYGHRHANNLRFSVWRERGGNRELVFEDYDWNEPAMLEYSSIITNPPPNPAAQVAGGYSGLLDVRTGDNMYFECEVINMTNRTFTGANEAIDDEMCILIGDSVGATVSPRCTQDDWTVR